MDKGESFTNISFYRVNGVGEAEFLFDKPMLLAVGYSPEFIDDLSSKVNQHMIEAGLAQTDQTTKPDPRLESGLHPAL